MPYLKLAYLTESPIRVTYIGEKNPGYLLTKTETEQKGGFERGVGTHVFI